MNRGADSYLGARGPKRHRYPLSAQTSSRRFDAGRVHRASSHYLKLTVSLRPDVWGNVSRDRRARHKETLCAGMLFLSHRGIGLIV